MFNVTIILINFYFRSTFKFFAITFGSSFLNVIVGYFRFSVEGNTLLAKKYMSKQALACMLVIIVKLAAFIYIVMIIEIHFVLNIVVRNFYGDQFNRYYVSFNSLIPFGDFNFLSLVFPALLLFLSFGITMVFVFVKSIQQMGLVNTLKLLKYYPTLFLFSILTNLIFDFEPAENILDNIEEQQNTNENAKSDIIDEEQNANEETKQKCQFDDDISDDSDVDSEVLSQTQQMSEDEVIAESLENVEFTGVYKVDGEDEIVQNQSKIECLDVDDTKTFYDQIVSNIKFSVKNSKLVFKIWLTIHLPLLISHISLRVARDQLRIPLDFFLLIILFIYIIAVIYIIKSHQHNVVPALTGDNLDGSLPPPPTNALEEDGEDCLSMSSLTTSVPQSSSTSTSNSKPPRKVLNKQLSRKEISGVLLVKETIINGIRLHNIV